MPVLEPGDPPAPASTSDDQTVCSQLFERTPDRDPRHAELVAQRHLGRKPAVRRGIAASDAVAKRVAHLAPQGTHLANLPPPQESWMSYGLWVIREMAGADFAWAAHLLARKRAQYRELSPVFWNPALDVDAAHGAFLRSTAGRPEVIALRSDRGFLIGIPTGDRTHIDDFTVDEPEHWQSDGAVLLRSAANLASTTDQPELRVVTARLDRPKRDLLRSMGLRPGSRWWVKELVPAAEPTVWGSADLDGVPGLIMPSPPVYDPGGPVCLFGNVSATEAVAGAEAARRAGAVLAIVRREGAPPEHEPELEAAGFHNPSEFYDGRPTSTSRAIDRRPVDLHPHRARPVTAPPSA